MLLGRQLRGSLHARILTAQRAGCFAFAVDFWQASIASRLSRSKLAARSAGLRHIALAGPMFDASFLMAEAAARGHGIALLPIGMFENDLASRRLVQPFALSIANDAYWLVRPTGRLPSHALNAFQDWIARKLVEV